MKTRSVRKLVVFNAVLAIALGVAFSSRSFVQNDVSHAQAKTGPALPSPTPPKKEDDVTLNSDDVVRVETNLTNVFFTAADKQKRFVSTLKKEDFASLRTDAPGDFAFQPNSDLPLLSRFDRLQRIRGADFAHGERRGPVFLERPCVPKKTVPSCFFTGEAAWSRG
jgi:hypothetical protein